MREPSQLRDRRHGVPDAPVTSMMFVENLATAADVTRLLGEVDPLVIARILAVAPTRDEVDEAARTVENELGFAEEPRTPSSARVACVRAVIAELVTADLETDPAQELRSS
jgi:hypothetical protein